jgi:hypothetical protein
MNVVEQALKNLSWTNIATRSGVSLAGVWLIFHGKRRGSIGTLRKIAGALAVGLDDLDSYLQKLPKPEKRPWPKLKPKSKVRGSVAA